MLTCKTISPQKAVEYFLQGYYLEGTSRWFGKGAEILGLQGAVNDEQVFSNVAQGLSPDGSEELCARKLEVKDRRAALDCTFSAPKSVSLTALVGGDSRLITAHNTAVEKALAVIQERYAKTRVMVAGERDLVNTGNLVVAEFDHIESRELDPHLHTHCLVMNMVTAPNGKWYSQHNDEIYRNKKLLGMVYQSYLAMEVQKLGYEISPRAHGQFEIKGYSSEQLMDFSKRRQQILAAVDRHSGWSERSAAWETTRKRKEKVSPEELKQRWLEEAAALGITFIQPGEPKPELKPTSVNQKTLEDAIAHCSERTVAFKQEDLEKFILSEGRPLDVTQLEPSIKESAELIRIVEPNGVRFTTQAALQRELATIRLMQQGQGKVRAIAPPSMVERHFKQTTLNSGQRQAVQLLVTTTDQFVAWQGVAGAGKTYTLNECRLLAQAMGYTIKGFAPSAMAALVLGEELGIEANTVARLLVSTEPQQVESNQIWIVDEAGLLSAKDAHALLQRATQSQARVILVGDTKQLSAVEAGNPFKSLQQAGIGTAYLNESQRQRTPELKLAVDLIASGQVEAGCARLEAHGCIQQVTAASRVDAIALEYMVATPEQRSKTLVLAGTNAERLDITHAIRSKLRAEGSLGQEAITTQLKALDLTTVQMKYTHHFEVGDVVMPTRSYKRRGLEKGELYEMVGKTQDRLTLKAADGTHLTVDTGFSKAVYQRHQMEVAVGDRLKWTKNDRKLGRRNGQEFTVTEILGNSAQIQYLDGGHTETINLAQAQHLDYALVSTTYSSQGKTSDRVLIAADYTVGKESFYVAVSRAKYELKLYTEDKTELLSLAKLPKAQENPLELLRQQVREQVAVESVKSSYTVPEKPRLKREAPSSIPSVEAHVAPPIKRTSKKPKRVEISNPLAPGQDGSLENKTPSPNQSSVSRHFKRSRKPDKAESEPLRPAPETEPNQPVEAFWIPGSTGEAPPHIEPEHWRELVEGSAIHPAIAARNFKSLQEDPVEQEHSAWGHLMYSSKLERSNTGRLSSGILKRYSHIEAGGWWCGAGVDSRSFKDLQPGQKPTEQIWGCYKPNAPRENVEKPGKKIKYEHPPKADLSIFLLDVPDELAERIFSKAGVNPSASDRTSGFWYCVWKYNVPITITEGAKKAASLLSQGRAAIGLPGIYAGYRSKDSQGNPIEACLMEELAVFATKDREIRLCFDYETRPEPKRNIDIAISRTGSLFLRQGAKVSVVNLPGPEKGVDDFIDAQGPLAYEERDREALRLKDWRARNNSQQRLVEPPLKLSLEERKERQLAKLAGLPPSNSLAVNNPEQTAESAASEQPFVPSSPQAPVEQPGQDQDINHSQEYDQNPEHSKTVDNTSRKALRLEKRLHENNQSPQQLWQRYSQNADPQHPLRTAGIVALAAMKDNHPPETIYKILEQDPEIQKIRHRGGDEMVQIYLKTVMRAAEARMPQQNQQFKQTQQEYDRGLGL